MFYHGARLNVTCNQKFKILACRLSIIKDISGLIFFFLISNNFIKINHPSTQSVYSRKQLQRETARAEHFMNRKKVIMSRGISPFE